MLLVDFDARFRHEVCFCDALLKQNQPQLQEVLPLESKFTVIEYIVHPHVGKKLHEVILVVIVQQIRSCLQFGGLKKKHGHIA